MIDLSNKRLMVLSPHADDAEFGAGGFIHKVVKEGGEVLVVLATNGDIDFLHNGAVTATTRMDEFHASMNVLGVKQTEVVAPGYDSRLNQFHHGKFVKELDILQEEFRPDIILLPLPSAHQDHRYCWEVGIASTRPSIHKHSPTIVAAYEYPLSSWGDGADASAFRGGMYVDVSEEWYVKIESLRQYKSQLRGDVAALSVDGVTAMAQLRGIETGCKYAELLYILRINLR